MNNTNELFYHFIYHNLKTKYLFIFVGNNNAKLIDIQSNEKYNFFDYSQFKKDNIHIINETIFYEDTISIIKAKILTHLHKYIPNISNITEIFVWKSNLIYTNQLYYILSNIFNNSIIKISQFINKILDIFNIDIKSKEFIQLLKLLGVTDKNYISSNKNIDFNQALKIINVFIQKNYNKYLLTYNKLNDILFVSSESNSIKGGNDNDDGENSKNNSVSIEFTNNTNISELENKKYSTNISLNHLNTSTNNSSSLVDFNSQLFSDESQIAKHLQDLDKNITQTYNLLYNDNLEFQYNNIINKTKYIYNLNPFKTILEIDANFINKNNEPNDNIKITNFNYQIEDNFIINFTTIIDVVNNIPSSIKKDPKISYYGILKKFFPKISYNKDFNGYFKELVEKNTSNIIHKKTEYINNFKKNLNYYDNNSNIIHNNEFTDKVHKDELNNIFLKYLYFTVQPIKLDFISLQTIFNKIETNNHIVAVKLYNQFGNHTYKINKDILNTFIINNTIKDFKNDLFHKEFIKPTEYKKHNKDYTDYMIFFININDEHNTIIYIILYDNGRYDIKYELKKTSNIYLANIFESFHIINNLLNIIEKNLFYYYSFYKLNSDILFKKVDYITNLNINATTQITYFPYNLEYLPYWLNNNAKSILQFISNSTTTKSKNFNKIYYYKYKNYEEYNELDTIFESYSKYLNNNEYKTSAGKKKLEEFISHIFNVDYNYLKAKEITKDDKITFTKYSKQAFNIPNTIKLFINNKQFLQLTFNNIRFNNIYMINKYILTVSNIFYSDLENYTSKSLTNINFNSFLRIINNTNKLFEQQTINNSLVNNTIEISKQDNENIRDVENVVDIENTENNQTNESNESNVNINALINNNDLNNDFTLNQNNNNNNTNMTNMSINNNAHTNENKNVNIDELINEINNSSVKNNNNLNDINTEKIDEAFIIDKNILDSNIQLFSLYNNTNKSNKYTKTLMNKISSSDHYINPEYFDKDNKLLSCKDTDTHIKHYLIYNKYKQIDKHIFSSDAKYSKKCPSGNCRKPIIITEKERKKIDKEHPGSYIDYIKLGSTEKIKKKYVYFCPNLWCPLSRTSITREYYDKHKSCPIKNEQPIDFQLPPYFAKINKETSTSLDITRYHRFPVFIQGTSLPCCMKTRYNVEDTINNSGSAKIAKFYKHDPQNIYDTYLKKIGKTEKDEFNDKKEDNYIIAQSSKLLEVGKYGELIPEINKIIYNYYIISDDIKINIFRKGIIQNSYNFITSVIYLLNNPKVSNINEFINVIQLNMSPFDYMQLNNGSTLKKYHKPSEIPIINDDLMLNNNNLEILLVIIKKLLQWYSLHSIYITHFQLENFYNILIKINNINKLKEFLENTSKNQGTIDILKRELIIYNSFKNFIKYLKNQNISKDIDDIYDIFSSKYSHWMNIHNYTLIVFHNNKLLSKSGKKIESKNFIYIPKYSSINDLNHLSNCICISKINNKYEPLVILEYLKSSSDKRLTKLREFKVFHHNLNTQFLYKFNSLVNIYKNTHTNETLLYFNNAYNIFKFLATNNEFYVTKFVINYNFKLTGFLLENNYYIPLEFETSLIPKNLIFDFDYYEIKYVYIDEIFNLNVDINYNNFNDLIDLFNNLNNITKSSFYAILNFITTQHTIENTNLDNVLYKNFTKQFYDVELFHTKLKYDIYEHTDNKNENKNQNDINLLQEKKDSTKILHKLLKDNKYKIVAIYYNTQYKDKFSPINMSKEYKTLITPYIINKYIVLNSNYIISNVFNNLEHLYAYNLIFNQILVKIIENNNYEKELYYIKHPVNPLPISLKLKYIIHIINKILLENSTLKENFIKLINENIINPTQSNVNKIFDQFINNMSNDILYKEINYILKKISEIQIIGDNDIYITQKDYNNDKFNKQLKKIQNLYQNFYSSSNDNVEYINISELKTSSINHSSQLFNVMIENKKKNISKFNQVYTLKYKLDKFNLYDMNNDIIKLFSNISQLYKYDITPEFIKIFIIKHYYNLLSLNDNKAKFNLLYYLYHNDEAFCNYIHDKQVKLTSLAKKSNDEIVDIIKEFKINIHKGDKLYFSHYNIEILAEYFKINIIVINNLNNENYLMNKIKCYKNNNTTNYLFLYYENMEFKLILIDNKAVANSYIYDVKLFENYYTQLFEPISNIVSLCNK